MKHTKHKVKQSLGANIFKWILFTVLIIYCLSLLLPLLWMLYTACKTHDEYVYSTFALPKSWTLSNFGEAWRKLYMDIPMSQGIVRVTIYTMALNSVSRAGLGVVGLVFF